MNKSNFLILFLSLQSRLQATFEAIRRARQIAASDKTHLPYDRMIYRQQTRYYFNLGLAH
jgi:hypothetical protein